MRGTAVATIILALAAAAPAHAADFPVKAPPFFPAAPPLFSWTGCYVGGHLGVAISEDRNESVTGGARDFSTTGIVGGGQIGCDYQVAPRWVVGVEGRAAGTSLKENHPSSVIFLNSGTRVPSQFSLTNDFLASATGRLGYSFAPRWLVFARGGAAWTQEKAEDPFTNLRGISVNPSATTIRTGWTVGGGVEWAFLPQWSTTLEYNYYNFGSHGMTLTDGATGGSVHLQNLTDTIHTVTAGVNYRF